MIDLNSALLNVPGSKDIFFPVKSAVTDEEIEEAYKKMLEDKNKKCQEI